MDYSHFTIRTIFSLFLCIAIITGCGQNNSKEKAITNENIVIAKGYIVPSDSIVPPIKIVAGEPEITKVNKLQETVYESNITSAGAPELIDSLTPSTKTPGTQGIELPVIKKTESVRYFCGAPERTEVKEAFIKENNPFSFSSYSQLQGLKGNQLRTMMQDSLGNLWLGTDDGLVKYDGKYFYHYSQRQGLKSNLILSLIQDSKGNIWIGSFRGGATKYDGINFTFFDKNNGLPDNVVNCIFEDSSGRVWLGTGKGLACFNGSTSEIYSTQQGLCGNDIRTICQDKQGKLWIGSAEGGFSVFDGKSFKNYSIRSYAGFDFVSEILKDKRDNIWLATRKGVIKFDGQHFYGYTTSEGLQSNFVRGILQERSGDMWFTYDDNGVCRFDGNFLYQYGIDQGLSSDFVKTALQDREGNIWFATRLSGLTRYDGDKFTHLTKSQGLSNDRVMNILEVSADELWFGTFGGYVTIYKKKKIDNKEVNSVAIFGKNEGLSGSRVYSLIRDKKGRIWIGTDGGGITCFDGSKTYSYSTSQGLVNNTIRQLTEDELGNIWIATYGSGVVKFDGTCFFNYTVRQGLSSNNVQCIFQDSKGRIWFGTDGGGMTLYDGKSFTHFNKSNGFFDDIVYCIKEDNLGNIWMGTSDNGVVRYNGKYFISYTESAGLSNNKVFSITDAGKNLIAAGTRSGLNIIETFKDIKVDSLLNKVNIKNYNYEDGFTGISCNLDALYIQSDGTLWAGTTNKLTAFHKLFEREIPDQTNIQITNLQLFNENIPWPLLNEDHHAQVVLHNGIKMGKIKFNSVSKWYNLPQNLRLSHNNNFINFNYIDISHSHTTRIRYQYKLSGIDKNWNMPTEKTEASYGNLPPGKYTFSVRVTGDDNIIARDASYSFEIMHPWWATTWFYITIILIIIASIYLFIYYREKKLLKDKALLEEKVKSQTGELTEKNRELQKVIMEKDKLFTIIAHDLRGPFSSFIGITQLISEDIASFTKDEISALTNKMSQSAKNLYDLLENLLQWSRMQQRTIQFNPSKINIKDSIVENTGWIINSAEEKGINLTFEIPNDIIIFADPKMIETITRNLLSNAIKFTPRGGSVKLTVSKNAKRDVEIRVADDGIGMSKELVEKLFRLNVENGRSGTEGEPSTGLGLIICRELVEKHKGTLSVESAIKKGSIFTVTLPGNS
jgi:ligand-binding sensor domain-containing protein/signal transduction histidine kinase